MDSVSHNTKLIMSNYEIQDVVKIVKSLKNFSVLLKGVNKTIKNKAKLQIRGFLSILLGILGASILRNILTAKRAIATSQRRGVNRAGEGAIAKRHE